MKGHKIPSEDELFRDGLKILSPPKPGPAWLPREKATLAEICAARGVSGEVFDLAFLEAIKEWVRRTGGWFPPANGIPPFFV